MNKALMNSSKITPARYRVLIVLFIALVVLSCAQDSIFYDLSMEPEPKDPIIPGSPTNMAVVQGKLYVGTRMSKRIYYFDGTGWNYMSTEEGSLGELAAGSDGTNTYLYALIFSKGDPLKSSMVRRYNPATKKWDKEISHNDYSIQSLYSAGNILFAAGQDRSDTQKFDVLCFDLNLSSFTVNKESSFLKGAAIAGTDIYLATSGNGVQKYDGTKVTNLASTDPAYGKNITGILSVVQSPNETVIAVSNNGDIFTLNAGGSSFIRLISAGVNFTGAMGIWKNYDGASAWNPSLVLLGIRGEGTSRTHGYRELPLDLTGKPVNTLRTPGDYTPSSVKNKPKYTSSIGTHPVMSIMQIPDAAEGGPVKYADAIAKDPEWEPPIFAATAKNGVWSYRGGQWNAE